MRNTFTERDKNCWHTSREVSVDYLKKNNTQYLTQWHDFMMRDRPFGTEKLCMCLYSVHPESLSQNESSRFSVDSLNRIHQNVPILAIVFGKMLVHAPTPCKRLGSPKYLHLSTLATCSPPPVIKHVVDFPMHCGLFGHLLHSMTYMTFTSLYIVIISCIGKISFDLVQAMHLWDFVETLVTPPVSFLLG